jgi:hypothetical protein
MKKTGDEKSRDTVPLNTFLKIGSHIHRFLITSEREKTWDRLMKKGDKISCAVVLGIFSHGDHSFYCLLYVLQLIN